MYEDGVFFEDDEGNAANEATDSEDDYANSPVEYDVDEPRQREHQAYKIAQDNAGRARRRFKYGDDVDDDVDNEDSSDGDSSVEEDEEIRKGRLRGQLQNAREARAWELDEANRRYEWNARWTGGVHEGVEREADKRMDDVEQWNKVVEDLEEEIGSDSGSNSKSRHDPESGSDSDSDDEYEKNVRDARSARGRGYNDDEEVEDWENEKICDSDYEESD